jgi:hypothetical protein
MATDAGDARHVETNLDVTEKPAAPPVALWRSGQSLQTHSTAWLRDNWIAVAFFTLAVGTAYRAATGLLHASTITILAGMLDAPPEDFVASYLGEADANNISGCALTAFFFVIGACGLRNAKARLLIRTVPFAMGLACCVGCGVWMIIFAKTPNYPMAFVTALWGSVLFGCCQMSLYGLTLQFLDNLSNAPERQTTVAHTRPATTRDLRKLGLISDGED